MVDQQISSSCVRKADEDFEYAKASLEKGLDFPAQICFHFHQAAEKYLKAYIVEGELEFQRIHDLTKLLQVCSSNDQEFKNLEGELNELNPFYIETRYPDFLGVVDKSDAENALRIVGKVASLVKSKLEIS